jgi:hypothetical protein
LICGNAKIVAAGAHFAQFPAAIIFMQGRAYVADAKLACERA